MCFFAAFASVSLDTTYRNKNSYTICTHTVRVHNASACNAWSAVPGHQIPDKRGLCNGEDISAHAQRSRKRIALTGRLADQPDASASKELSCTQVFPLH